MRRSRWIIAAACVLLVNARVVGITVADVPSDSAGLGAITLMMAPVPALPPAAGIHLYAPDSAAVCGDWTAAGSDAATACAGHGGVRESLTAQSVATVPRSAAVESADLYSSGPASQDLYSRSAVDQRAAVGPVSVQGPASGIRGTSSLRAENPTGPLNVSAELNIDVCRGGPIQVTAYVFDDNGNAVKDATVSGSVWFSNSDSTLQFPNKTDDKGYTQRSFNIGSVRGGYTVQFSIHAESNGNAADTAVGCWAP